MTSSTKRRFTIRRSFVLSGLVALTLGVIFHAPLLAHLARLLIHDQPVPASGFVVIVDGDRRFDVCAEMIRTGGLQGVLVMHGRTRPLARCGIVPTGHELARRELIARGVDPARISVIKADGRFLWDAAERWGQWLGQHEDELVVLTDQFGSRRVRYAIDQTVPADLAARIHVSALADRRFSERDWWKQRIGCRMFFSAWIELAYARIVGSPHPDDLVDWDPDVFERDLQATLANQ